MNSSKLSSSSSQSHGTSARTRQGKSIEALIEENRKLIAERRQISKNFGSTVFKNPLRKDDA